MSDLFFGLFIILFLVSLVGLIVGLVKPTVFSKLIKGVNRKKIGSIFGISLAVCFVGMIVTAPPTEPAPTKDPVDVAITQEEKSQKQENRSKKETTPQTITAGVSTDINTPIKPSGLAQVTIARVVDGDTVVTTTGERIRYIGIDTPETVHPYKAVEFYGKEASDKNKSLVEGKTVELEKDVSNKDKYGRTLAYIWLGNEMINAKLVAEGYAYAYTYPPDVKHSDYFVALQRQAQQKKLGLWVDYQDSISKDFNETPPSSSNETENTSLPPQPPVNNISPPSNTPPPENDPAPETCNIKGNISSSGEKIYHVPGGRYYDVTQIDISAGERWFCSESEAVSAGWRKSKL